MLLCFLPIVCFLWADHILDLGLYWLEVCFVLQFVVFKFDLFLFAIAFGTEGDLYQFVKNGSQANQVSTFSSTHVQCVLKIGHLHKNENWNARNIFTLL